jgi:hypothetical protein
MGHPRSDKGGPTPEVLQVRSTKHWAQDAADQEGKPGQAGYEVGRTGTPAVRARSRAALLSAPSAPTAHPATRSGSTNATTTVLTTFRPIAAVSPDPRGPL